MYFLNNLFGWGGIFLGLALLCVFWPAGLAFLVIGWLCLKDAAKEEYWSIAIPRKGRSMDFGPEGVFWAHDMPPILLGDLTIFPSAIRSMCEWGATGPEFDVRGSSRKERPKTAQSACIEIILHSGETHRVTGECAKQLRIWFEIPNSD